MLPIHISRGFNMNDAPKTSQIVQWKQKEEWRENMYRSWKAVEIRSRGKIREMIISKRVIQDIIQVLQSLFPQPSLRHDTQSNYNCDYAWSSMVAATKVMVMQCPLIDARGTLGTGVLESKNSLHIITFTNLLQAQYSPLLRQYHKR